MLEYDDIYPEWYSLHMLQSNQIAIDYYKQIRTWLELHTHEIVILYISKHGSGCKTGEDQYPNISIEQKQSFWYEIMNVFDGLLVDFSITKVNETSIGTMIDRNHRVVLYVADYIEMTNSSNYALDQCSDVDNGSNNPGIFKIEQGIDWQRETYANATTRKELDKLESKFYKISLATGGSEVQAIASALLDFLPHFNTNSTNNSEFIGLNMSIVTQKCADDFNIPNMTWCPDTLLDIAQLESYYNQIAMDEVLDHDDWSFPNGIYLNGLDRDGTVRTGTQVLWGGIRNKDDIDHWTTAYAYVDTIIAVNIKISCSSISKSSRVDSDVSKLCHTLTNKINKRRELYPLSLWDDAAMGRSTTWPN